MLSLLIGSAQAAEPAHGEGGSSFPPFDPTHFPSTIFWLAVTFGALYWLMSRIALPRVAEILETREAKIAGDLKSAAMMQEKARSAGDAYEKLLADARAGAQATAQQARDAANAAAEQKRKAVEAETQQKIAASETEIAAARDQAMTNVAAIAADAAAAIVARITGAEPNADDVRRAVAGLQG
jgi:F-type H+-transporting ATPase subunit b